MRALIQSQLLAELRKLLVDEQQSLQRLLNQPKLQLLQKQPINTAIQHKTAADTIATYPLHQAAQIKLSQINKAINRIKTGSYGLCVVCGHSIHEERLIAIPHTPFCSQCISAH